MTKITQEKFDELVESEVEKFINDWSMNEDDYEELINETHPEIDIFQMTYQAGDVLRAVDPIAFRCGIADEECPDHEIDEERDRVIEHLQDYYEVEN